jgi:hypothetical protein
VFIGDEVLLAVSYAAAKSRLAALTDGGVLLSASQQAYGEGSAESMRVGAAGLAKVVRVRAAALTETAESAGLAIRWEASGPGGGLFPVLDADVTLSPVGDEVTLLALQGTYRPPLGAVGDVLDRAMLHRVAAATIRNFISGLATDIAGSPAVNS